MSRCAAVFLLLATTMASWQVALADTVHVDCDNTSGIEDGSSDHPFQLISDGMVAASFGDTILVMPGTYSENSIVDMHDPDGMNRAAVIMKDGVTLLSRSGPDSTLISGVGTEAVVYFDSCGSETILRGFSLENGGFGWGLRCSVLCWASSPTITSNTVSPPMAGIYCRSQSSPTIEGNAVVDGVVAFLSGSGGVVIDNDIEGEVSFSSSQTPSLPLDISSNVIRGLSAGYREGHGIFISWGGPGEVNISGNTVIEKDIGAIVCRGRLRHNRFMSNNVNVMIHDQCAPWEDIDAEMNWWGTTDPAEIEAKIIDCGDDGGIPGCVDYEPWCLNEDCTQSPIRPISWGLVKDLYRPR